MFYEDKWGHRLARKILRRLGVSLPVSPLAHRGLPYRDMLLALHETLHPESYLEIGVQDGNTLKLASCYSVGVDPEPRPSIQPTTNRRLYTMSSDDFFKQDIPAIFPNGVDFAYIDGMHLMEYALRDIINTEKLCHPNSLIAIHDCLPINSQMAERDYVPDNRTDYLTRTWWTGDVWKLLPILTEYRPDLRVTCLDCPPTGLILVSKLNAQDGRLREKYDEIVHRYQPMTLDDYGFERFRRSFHITDSRQFTSDMSASLESIGISVEVLENSSSSSVLAQ